MTPAPKPSCAARSVKAVAIRLERRVRRKPDATLERAAALLRLLLAEINAERESTAPNTRNLH
jgi:hypothetical protein